MAPRDLTKLPHLERVAAATLELSNPASVRVTADLLKLHDQERLELVALHESAMRRHGVVPPYAEAQQPAPKDGQQLIIRTVAELAERYKTADPRYKRLGYRVRRYYDGNLTRILATCGEANLADIKNDDLKRLYNLWSEDGKKRSMGHAHVAMFRIMVNYGATELELSECVRLSVLLRSLKTRLPPSRTERITPEHVRLFIERAHRQGRDSLSLAQAIQFECPVRQVDVIGEWVPQSESGISDVVDHDKKWLRGLRWEWIDENLVLHLTKGTKEIDVDLRECPFVMQELKRLGKRPTAGPVIVDEDTGLPYIADKFRGLWRTIANMAGVPKNVKNMDSPGGKAKPSSTTATG